MARKLKAALASYKLANKQLQDKERRSHHATQMKVRQKAALSARTKASQKTKPPWLPFAIELDDYSEDSILLVGEGDFSFAVNLAEKFPSLSIVATSFDTREEVESKYPDGEENLRKLQEMDISLAFGIDATKLSIHRRNCAALQKSISMVVFNFPHLGNSMADQDRNIRQHQQLLLKFFQQCEDCEFPKVVVTLFDGEPYSSWKPKALARTAGYKIDRSGRFPWEEFDSYRHQLTNKGGSKTNKAQQSRNARIYLWVKDSTAAAESNTA